MWVVFGIAAFMGLYLAFIAGWAVIWIGLACILAALAYTGGPLPFGYYGLGDLMVFLFFGPLAVCGTYFVQAGQVSRLAAWSSIPVGLLIVAILVVNNLRDIESDRSAGKRTLAVRIGVPGTRREYAACVLGAYFVTLGVVLAGISPAWVALSGLSLPLAFRMIAMVNQQSGRPLNQALAGTGRLTLVFALLYSAGLVLAGIIG